ncbi:argininosuccinate lyase [PVC group bacterium (ex Bugula neritina AB1)]|nr:argininosuccinate lyase [PVC group bacterium (ex Bugula neritina AB1)]
MDNKKKVSSETNKKTSDKAWGGRFSAPTDTCFEDFSESVSFDWHLYDVDIQGSLAHAEMLHHIGILNLKEKDDIFSGLEAIRLEIEKEGFAWFDASLEDVHMNIEKRLIQKIGSAGEKLHTGRSRNDQVVLDLRMKLKQFSTELTSMIKSLQKSLVLFADRNKEVIIPEMTHTQNAQPVLLAHHMLAYVEMLERDTQRIKDSYQRIDVMPLGSGACVGSGLPLDRSFVCEKLGFSRLTKNSVDAVSDRDFVVEFMTNLTLLSTHLSRFCEEWILWSSSPFSYIELSDAFCTGSSMMPQKKNADALELIRAQTAGVSGDLFSLFSLLKALPLTYNRDMQDDKRRLFQTYFRMLSALKILKGTIDSTKVNEDLCLKAVQKGFCYATDMSDYLVKQGMPFRESHHVVGEVIALCCERKCEVADLSLLELQDFSKLFKEDLYDYINIKSCLESKNLIGGTAPAQVHQELKRLLEN